MISYGDAVERVRADIARSLAPGRDPSSSRAYAAAVASGFRDLSPGGRREIIFHLATNQFDIDLKAVKGAITALRKQAKSADAVWDNIDGFRQSGTSPRQRLFTYLNGTKNGLQFLIALRENILDIASQSETNEKVLAVLEAELRATLQILLDIGFASLTRITWDSPASLLEKLKSSEAVHEISDWSDLKTRVGAEDRRFFCLFHHSMPNDPLAFVEVALVNGLATCIHQLIDSSPARPKSEAPDTAIFYSITSPIKGLKRITFGNYLIKKVISETNRQFPHISTYATLSPIPGFRKWLKRATGDGASPLAALDDATRLALAEVANGTPDPSVLTENLRTPLLRSCATYLLSKSDDGRPLDDVTRFHLGNGAMIGQLNWRADLSKKGVNQSSGLMVNYVYAMEAIEANHMNYWTTSEIIAADAIKDLALPTPEGGE